MAPTRFALAASALPALFLVGCKDDTPGDSCEGRNKSQCNDAAANGCEWLDGSKDVCAKSDDVADYLAKNEANCTALGGSIETACKSTCGDQELATADLTDSNQQFTIGWPNCNEGESGTGCAWGTNGVLFTDGATRCNVKAKVVEGAEGTEDTVTVKLTNGSENASCRTAFATGAQTGLTPDQWTALQPVTKASASSCINLGCLIQQDSEEALTCAEPAKVCASLKTDGGVTECFASKLGVKKSTDYEPCLVNTEVPSGTSICEAGPDTQACTSQSSTAAEGASCASGGNYEYCAVGTEKRCSASFECVVDTSKDSTCGWSDGAVSDPKVNDLPEDSGSNICTFYAAGTKECIGDFEEL